MSFSMWIRTTLLLAFLTALFMGIGYIFAGSSGALIAFVFAFLLNFFAFWYSDKIVLAMYGAKPFENEEIKTIVEKLAKNAKIPVPKLYICEIPVPNAFATGRSPRNAAVCVTKGLVEILDKEEIEGVLAHELAHIKNRDTLISTLAAVLAGAISYLANIAWWTTFGEREERSALLLPLLILAPLGAMLIQLAISRGREFLADYTGAIISNKPLALASALRKISEFAKAHPMHVNPGTSHMFIVNPLSAEAFAKLFSTHPPTEERIKRLEEIAKRFAHKNQ